MLPRRGGNAHWKLKIFSVVQRRRYFDIKLCTSMRRPHDSTVDTRAVEAFRLNKVSFARHCYSSFSVRISIYKHII